jgi:N utilization substance protein B
LFWQNFEAKVDSRDFTNELVEGTWRERERIDKIIAEVAENWRLGRLPRVDLNLLRLGVYELLSYPQLAPGVTINEAIEIARLYCGDEAPTFINGVLDRVAVMIGKKAQTHESSE